MRRIQFVCDGRNCGRLSDPQFTKTHNSDAKLPMGWRLVYVGQDDVLLCPACIMRAGITIPTLVEGPEED